MTIATGILVMVALTVGGTLVAAVAYAVITRGRGWWRELLSIRVLPFVFMGLAVGLTTFGIGFGAMKFADEALRFSVDDIESDCDDQLSILLHSDAGALADALTQTKLHSSEELRKFAMVLGIDEVSIVDTNGLFVLTTDERSQIGKPFFTDEKLQGVYHDLLNGRRTMVRQRFRPNASCNNQLVKYFGMSLPDGGFLQCGYLWETFEREFPRYFLPLFEGRVIGNTGFCVVLNGDNRVDVNVAGHPDVKGMSAAEIGLEPQHLTMAPGKIFRARLFGTLCRCLFYEDKIADRRILAAVPLSERQWQTLTIAAAVAFVLLAAFLVFRLVLRNFRRAQEKIDSLRAAEEARRAGDLALARSIQRAELRTDGTDGDGYHIATLMNAAREVGGDFYDYYELNDGRLAITIADVSGKGVPAAFFMMKARTTVKASVYTSASVAEAAAAANVRLSANNPAEMFVTVWLGIYDRKTGVLDFVSAGHNPPLVRHADGSVEWVKAPRAAAMGVFESAKYRSSQVRLAPGDRIFLYTDGVTEAMNGAGELFGDARLESAVAGGSGDLIATVAKAVETYVAGAEQSDDITMLELSIR